MSRRLIDADALERAMYEEAFEKDTDMQRWDSGCWIRYKLYERVLDAQPIVDIEPHWIPCSERLPNEEGYYLTSDSKGVQISKYRVAFMLNGNHFGAWLDDNCAVYEPIAWMPLPKPYKENDDAEAD